MGATFGKVPDVGLLKSVQMKAGQMGADWGKLTAAFSGFTSASTVIRGRYAAFSGCNWPIAHPRFGYTHSRGQRLGLSQISRYGSSFEN